MTPACGWWTRRCATASRRPASPSPAERKWSWPGAGRSGPARARSRHAGDGRGGDRGNRRNCRPRPALPPDRLVPRRREDVDAAARSGVNAVHVSVPVSEIHLRAMEKNQGWAIRQMTDCVSYARRRFEYVSVGAQDASRARRVSSPAAPRRRAARGGSISHRRHRRPLEPVPGLRRRFRAARLGQGQDRPGLPRPQRPRHGHGQQPCRRRGGD